MALVLILKEDILIRINNIALGEISAHRHWLVRGLHQALDLLLVLMIEAQQIILKAILFIIEEEVIQLRIASPSRIKSCFHLCNLFLKLFKELQIPSTLNHELVDLLIKWWQHAVADFSHYAIEGHNLIQQLHWRELRQVCQRAFNIRIDIGSSKYLQLLWFEQIWTSHKLLVEHVEIKTSGFDKLGIRIARAPFWRHRWHI